MPRGGNRSGTVNLAVDVWTTMDDGGGARRSRGSRDHQPRSSAARRSPAGGKDGEWPWSKRLRLQRDVSFGEDQPTLKSSCTGRSAVLYVLQTIITC